MQVGLTVFAKSDGPLTKRISLAENGSLTSDSSACIMAHGTARRFEFCGALQFAALIEQLPSHEAIALGALRRDLPDRVDVVTKRKLSGALRPDIIARTADYLTYEAGRPALALIDHDTKAMPPGVRARIDALGGLWPALISSCPALTSVARIERRSTSAGLYRTDTGAELPGSGGRHVFIFVRDGTDCERFLKTLHLRCWLAGFGWMMTGAGGQLLERSIVDRVVGSPERLVFEGPPILDPPLAQDQASRCPKAIEGPALDTIAACPPLDSLEQAKIRELRAKETIRLSQHARKARGVFITSHVPRLSERTGLAEVEARRLIERQCDGILLPGLALPFDDEELAGATVADVLADPGRFEGETLADPLEGIEYGTGKAKVLLRADGTPWINSFAHGRTIYELRFDYRVAAAAIEKAPKIDADDLFVRYALAGDLDEGEIEALRNLAYSRSGTGKRALDHKLKDGRKGAARARAQQERDRRMAERQDPRPEIPVPKSDAEWLPPMGVINAVLGTSRAPEPPMRNANKVVAQSRSQNVPSLHFLTNLEANDDDE